MAQYCFLPFFGRPVMVTLIDALLKDKVNVKEFAKKIKSSYTTIAVQIRELEDLDLVERRTELIGKYRCKKRFYYRCDHDFWVVAKDLLLLEKRCCV